jgi:hypothetical protein
MQGGRGGKLRKHYISSKVFRLGGTDKSWSHVTGGEGAIAGSQRRVLIIFTLNFIILQSIIKIARISSSIATSQMREVRHLSRHSAPAAPWQVREVGTNGYDRKKEDVRRWESACNCNTIAQTQKIEAVSLSHPPTNNGQETCAFRRGTAARISNARQQLRALLPPAAQTSSRCRCGVRLQEGRGLGQRQAACSKWGKVWGVGCGVWGVRCGVWCVVCGVWCVVCGVWCVVCEV